MMMMSVIEMMSPSPASGRLVGVSSHTVCHLTVAGGVRAVRDLGWARVDMLKESYGVDRMRRMRRIRRGLGGDFMVEAGLIR